MVVASTMKCMWALRSRLAGSADDSAPGLNLTGARMVQELQPEETPEAEDPVDQEVDVQAEAPPAEQPDNGEATDMETQASP